MGSNKEHHLIGEAHDRTVSTVKRTMHARRNGHLYRSFDGINWELEIDSAGTSVPEGATRVDESEQPYRGKRRN